ncbi:MAG: YebC/PmpR family DNA-binding transcriptional regulator [Bacteroidetes bacterium]|nr:MAG: YebC/PmpR family DNA-binding transcriptional regulator [Bacteroidota bacterium]REK06625.1 MAG: YebC/PmpR family DNA-binding transcriptional regulator [Bacteroidota bacterium]REK33391.1 MAG: YebC/PmpR family DNA-binding transcriptional regulator [Bacteroidota bacterium]REK49790.1 MAG: YebC/PmpR family DNA-binding transcriptional regulator [Bacteroidota bacterium]
MGRIFEKRKHKMFARYDKMAKAFTKVGREIAIAVKAGGPDPEYNPRLRTAILNAKGLNMPKDRIDNAIKRASSKDEGNYEETVYEGYGPYGVAIVVETATDNPTRTVANIRMYFNRGDGTLGKTGSLDFMFQRKGVFRIAKDGKFSLEDLELELIDFGLESLESDDEEIIIYTAFEDFGKMSKALEDKGIEIKKSAAERIPTTTVELSEEQTDEILQLIDKFEEDDDVQAVYHNLK